MSARNRGKAKYPVPVTGHVAAANPLPMEGDEEGHGTEADNGLNNRADLSPTIAQIRYWYRRLCFAEDQRKRSDNALGAFVRLQMGWSKALPTEERERIAEEAAALIEAPAGELEDIIRLALDSIQPFRDYEKRAEKEMVRLAETLPVWEAWAKPIKNVGAKSVARIVAEAGDLAAYPKKGHLWKRMGVGRGDGNRQGACRRARPANCGSATATAHPARGDLGDRRRAGQGGPYREVYLRGKATSRKASGRRADDCAGGEDTASAAEFVGDDASTTAPSATWRSDCSAISGPPGSRRARGKPIRRRR